MARIRFLDSDFHSFQPFKPSRCITASSCISEERLTFVKPSGFGTKIFMEQFNQITVYLFHMAPTSSHLHPLQVENCDSNSRLVVDEYDNGKLRLERVNCSKGEYDF